MRALVPLAVMMKATEVLLATYLRLLLGRGEKEILIQRMKTILLLRRRSVLERRLLRRNLA